MLSFIPGMSGRLRDSADCPNRSLSRRGDVKAIRAAVERLERQMMALGGC